MRLPKAFPLITTFLLAMTPGLAQTLVAQEGSFVDEESGVPLISDIPLISNVFAGNVSHQGNALKVRFFGFGPMEDSVRSAIKEDCAILNQLVSQSIPLHGRRASLGVNVISAFGPNEAIYLDGTGLIFTYHVGFPVAPLQEPIPDGAGSPAAGDTSEWERARKQLETRSSRRLVRQNEATLFHATNVRSLMYEADRVKDLQDAMVKTMRQVTNFRNLDSGDTVIVYVYGPGIENGDKTVMACRVKISNAENVETVQYLDKANTTNTQAGFFVDPNYKSER